uniref:Dynein regulatory complex protein 10 n=1 Tax=Denticeps clupeoides TaxID=299321 RepID=A0AAY4EUP1_9TELE
METQWIAIVLDECITKMVDVQSTAKTYPKTLCTVQGTELCTVIEEQKTLGPCVKDAHMFLKDIVDVQLESCDGLLEGLRELQTTLLEQLLTTQDEEWKNVCRMKEIYLHYKKNLELKASLELDVVSAIKNSKKNESVRELKNSLHQVVKQSGDFCTHIQQDGEKQKQSDQNTSKGCIQRMQQEISHIKLQLNNLICENREAELALRKRTFKTETEIENWIQKYDNDMMEKQTAMERMSLVFEEERAELQELEEHYSVLEVEYSQIMEEYHQAQEQSRQNERDRELKTRAATSIQSYWRGFCVRKAMRAKSKNKKGKKEKHKKGKK